MAFAKAQFAMSVPDARQPEKSRGQVLNDIARQTGVIAPELLNMPQTPVETAHIWSWFIEIGRARSSGWDVSALSWVDFWAYFELYGFRPQSWELQALRLLDDAYLMSRIRPDKKAIGKAGEFRMNKTGPEQLN